jgi:anaerobic magnesium-protoporphyrin IX monomethyl ester cyclase
MILINASPGNALKIFQPFLPIYVPIGIACLAAVAERRCINVRLIDQQVEADVVGLATKYVAELEAPYIFGFSVLTVALKSALEAAKALKQRFPDALIVFGGIHPTAMPEEVLSFEQVDVVIQGEGEEALFELYDCVKNRRDYTHISGLSYRCQGSLIHNPKRPIAGTLDDYPSFPYHLFSANKRYDLGFVISSRGCPYRCIFCSNRVITGRQYEFKSPGMIVEELELLLRKYHQRHILFIDDNFLVNKERIYLLIDLIKNKGLHREMSFSFQARGDNVNPKLLKDLFDAGFRSIFFGIETASDRIMRIIKKDETVAQCVTAVKMANEIGFNTSATFIYGFPTETHKDRMDCIRLSKSLNLDLVRYNNATPYPGTELFSIAENEGRLNRVGLYENFVSTATFIENPFKRIPFSYVSPSSTEVEIRRDLLLSYFAFYLDFGRLKKIFSRPPEQNLGWFNPGEKIIEVIRKLPALAFLSLMLFYKALQLFYYLFIRPDTAIGYKYLARAIHRYLVAFLGKRGQASEENFR